jgi:hypothetical protein
MDNELLSDSDDDDNNEAPPPVRRGRCRAHTKPVAALLALFIIGAFGFRRQTQQTRAADAVTRATARITLAANTSADPCEDLWDYACGSFESQAYERGSSISDFQRALDANLHVALGADGTTSASKYYQSCRGYTGNRTAVVPNVRVWQSGQTAGNVSFERVTLDEATTMVAVGIEGHITDPPTVYSRADPCGGYILDTAATVAGVAVESVALYSQPALVCSQLQWATNGSTLWILPSATAGACLAATSAAWPGSVSALFLALHPEATTAAIKESAAAMLEDIRDVFVDTLQAATYVQLARKIEAVAVRLDFSMPADAGLPVGPPAAFLDDYLRIEYERAQERLQDRRVRPSKWLMGADVVNAYYHGTTNSLAITPAMLLFGNEGSGSHALEHGKLGWVLAHELAHAIDNSGVHMSASGREGDVIASIANRAVYAGGVQCLESEFGTGGLTTGEDIADHIAMVATKTLMQRQPPAPSVWICAPACTELTSMQLFYVSFAQTWCSAAETPTDPTDVHSPGKVRVQHALAAVGASAAFGCPATTANVCTIAGF